VHQKSFNRHRRDDQEIGDRREDVDQARSRLPKMPALPDGVEDRLVIEHERHQRQGLEGLEPQSEAVFPNR
jgi:hypothetical protein